MNVSTGLIEDQTKINNMWPLIFFEIKRWNNIFSITESHCYHFQCYQNIYWGFERYRPMKGSLRGVNSIITIAEYYRTVNIH